MFSPFSPSLGFGLGLRACHYLDVLDGRPSVSWFEVVTENYMEPGGRPSRFLERVRDKFPLALHGVSLSIGSTDPLNLNYLHRLRELSRQFEPAIISDHLCWTGVDQKNVHDLMPLPYTEEALSHVVERILRVQDFLGRQILIENVSSYMSFAHSEMNEWQFLSEIAARADCGILLDINNIYVSAVNHSTDAMDYLSAIPPNRVGQIHLAGHSVLRTKQGSTYLIDTHDHPVCDEVWALYAEAVRIFGEVPTMVEWDGDIPEYSVLEAEIDKARMIAVRETTEGDHEPRYRQQTQLDRTSTLATVDRP